MARLLGATRADSFRNESGGGECCIMRRLPWIAGAHMAVPSRSIGMKRLPKLAFLRALWAVAVACTVLAGCKDSNPAAVVPAAYPARDSEAALIEILARTYQRKDYDTFATLFHPLYQYRPNTVLDDGTEYWGLDSELGLHRYWFGLDSLPPTPALGSRMQARQFGFEFTTRGEFEPPFYYPFEDEPIDPVRWSLTAASYSGQALIGSSGDTDFLLQFRWEFVVLRDRTAAAGDPNRFLLYRWIDLGSAAKSVRRGASG